MDKEIRKCFSPLVMSGRHTEHGKILTDLFYNLSILMQSNENRKRVVIPQLDAIKETIENVCPYGCDKDKALNLLGALRLSIVLAKHPDPLFVFIDDLRVAYFFTIESLRD